VQQSYRPKYQQGTGTLERRQDLTEPEPREAGGRHRFEVAAMAALTE
jgi:hypothetical protein